jgi:hypothetical protein
MGRYAYFNNGVEYKFWFGIQNSSDIEQWLGQRRIHFPLEAWEEVTDEDDEREELEMIRKWHEQEHGDEEDIPLDQVPDEIKQTYFWDMVGENIRWSIDLLRGVEEKVEQMAAENGWEVPEWDDFEGDQDGCDAMYEWLVKDKEPSAALANYCLGCYICLLLKTADNDGEAYISASYE